VYARVLKEGVVRPGDRVDVKRAVSNQRSVFDPD